MRVALTGATGLAGHPVAMDLSRAGHAVVTLGRRPSPLGLPHRAWRLGEVPDLSDIDAVVLAAFAHEPGRYRGGEGDDPEGFLALNRDGSLRVAEAAGRRPVLFLSSRAVYGAYPAGTPLSEAMTPRPDTLYGRMKAETEAGIAAAGGVSLRATGLHAAPPPGRDHKWRELFADFAAGRSVGPRVGTEVWAGDLAAAIRLILAAWPVPHRLYNVSDLVLDRRDLLAAYARIAGIKGNLPPRGEAGTVSEMETGRLRRLGWRPRGWPALEATLAAIAGQ